MAITKGSVETTQPGWENVTLTGNTELILAPGTRTGVNRCGLRGGNWPAVRSVQIAEPNHVGAVAVMMVMRLAA